MKSNLIEQFSLPKYIKGKSFAEASKLIENKFKDRTDESSINTKSELLERLSKAQEYIKELEAPQSQTEDFALGGDLEGESPQGGPGMESYLGAATTALDFGNDLFGPTGVDTSGAAHQEKVNVGMKAAGNTLKGAAEGAKIGGPVGAVVGGAVGLGAGLIGGNRQNDAANLANHRFTQSQNANLRESDFAYGGKMTNDYENGGRPKVSSISKSLPGLEDLSYVKSVDGTQRGVDESMFDVETDNRLVTDINPISDGKVTLYQRLKGSLPEIGGEALRYAPIAANALQLKNLDKPTPTTLDKIDKRYLPDYFDEAALLNKVDSSYNPNASKEGSGGSLAAYNTLERARQLNKTKAVSDAYLQGDNINRGENKTKQQFDLSADQFNIGQSNLEQDIRARDKGAYDTNKSKLIGSLGENLGAIGKEEKYKDMVEKSGICYDTKGAYICGSSTRLSNDDLKNVKDTNESKYGGYQNSDALFTNHLESLLNKKK